MKGARHVGSPTQRSIRLDGSDARHRQEHVTRSPARRHHEHLTHERLTRDELRRRNGERHTGPRTFELEVQHARHDYTSPVMLACWTLPVTRSSRSIPMTSTLFGTAR